jgi:hypothetical protein
VSWAKRDTETSAIAWTLTVKRAVDDNANLDLKEFDKTLAQKLATDEHLKIDSDRLASIAGKTAVDISGVGGSETTKLWERQVWVLTSLAKPAATTPDSGLIEDRKVTSRPATPSLFLVLSVAGPLNLRTQMNQTLSAVLATLEITDPDEAIKQRREAMANGAALLKRLADTEHKVDISLSAQPWFLMTRKDKPVGFMKVVQAKSRQAGPEGYEVTTWAMTQASDDKAMLYKRYQFVSAIGDLERWSEQLQVGSGKDSEVFIQSGTMDDRIADRKQQKPIWMINCDCGTDKKTKSQRKALGDVKGIYLPYAFGVLLPKVVDLKEPKSYLFATYVARTNDFDMRTFTVVGPSKTTVGGKEVAAVKILDKASEEDDPVEMWVNADGELLRIQGADGLVIEQSNHEAVLRRNANADSIITQMAKWALPR